MRGPAGVLGDLHRAKSSGRRWKLLLDAAAILLLLAVLSGIVMCVTSRVRRRLGVIAMVGGAAVCAVVYLLLVP